MSGRPSKLRSFARTASWPPKRRKDLPPARREDDGQVCPKADNNYPIKGKGIECVKTASKTWRLQCSNSLRQRLRLAFAKPAEIVDDVVDRFSDERPERLLRPIAEELVKTAIAKHLAAQESWPAESDCDRLDNAFAELERNRILCRQDYTDCQTCGNAELMREMQASVQAGGDPAATASYHNQDTDAVLETGLLFLAYGPGPGSEEIRSAMAGTTDSVRGPDEVPSL